MFEVFARIDDEHGVRDVPTGRESYNREGAEKLARLMQRKEPGRHFFVEWVPSEDEWNAY